jgi:plasmid stabilization system protein ParE
MRIRYNPRFDERLESVEAYILEKYGPSAVKDFDVRILKTCHLLGMFPNMGKPLLEPESGMSSDFKILVSGLHVIIYCVNEDYVEIISLLDTRTKELSALREMVQSLEDSGKTNQ